MFQSYKDKKILITGATGFKGTWLTYILEKLGARVRGFGLEPDTDPSLYKAFGFETKNEISICNILEPGLTDRIISEFKPDMVIHLASQPLVSESYKDPSGTFETNITGLVNLLETARKNCHVKNLLVITSDKCYSTEYGKSFFTENDPMGGLDPYSASKACAEIVAKSFYHSFLKEKGTNVVTARAGNIIGGGDWSRDRLIPDIVRSYADGSGIVLRNPDSIRPWQHVFDALFGYLAVGGKMLEEKMSGFNSFNFGPYAKEEVKVIDVVKLFAGELGINEKLISFVNPEFYETAVLKLDSSKVYSEAGWKGIWNTEKSVKASAEWYRAYYKNRKEIIVFSGKQIDYYLSDLNNSKTN